MERKKSITEILLELNDISNKIVELKKQIAKEYNKEKKSELIFSQDARIVGLDSMIQKIKATIWWISTYMNLANKYKEKDVESFLRSIGSDFDKDLTEKIMFKFLVSGLITLFHFKIDSMFQYILIDMETIVRGDRKGYVKLCELILKTVSLPVDGYEMDTLKVLTNIRNSYHNNSIHRGKDFEKELNGKNFSFKKGEKVDLDFVDVNIALDANVDVISRILLSDKIKGIDHIIKDDFASEMENF